MKTIDSIKEQLTGKHIVRDLEGLLREKDPTFAESEKLYLEAVEHCCNVLPDDFSPSLEVYLHACETDVISAVVYAGYLGFRVNLENFHHPIGIDFVHLDTIDYRKEHLFDSFTINYENAIIMNRFYENLPESLKSDCDAIQSYFTHLRCSGPKLAHYAGYIIGNHLLPWIEPGYRADRMQTMAFTAETEKYLGMLPL